MWTGFWLNAYLNINVISFSCRKQISILFELNVFSYFFNSKIKLFGKQEDAKTLSRFYVDSERLFIGEKRFWFKMLNLKKWNRRDSIPDLFTTVINPLILFWINFDINQTVVFFKTSLFLMFILKSIYIWNF